eukprot:1158895-Pelagomonas_calceolata.AAC.9
MQGHQKSTFTVTTVALSSRSTTASWACSNEKVWRHLQDAFKPAVHNSCRYPPSQADMVTAAYAEVLLS